MKRIYEIEEEKDLDLIVQALIQHGEKLILLYGDLGSGKTTLAKAFFREIGIHENQMSSPSFGVINSYGLEDGTEAHHIDLYRLQDAEEAFDLGLEDYLESGEYVLIEWPEVLSALWDVTNHLSIRIEQLNTGKRRFILRDQKA
jgi:tRNA threonylcarbamoyladenosine biosynthesis protein TsaE